MSEPRYQIVTESIGPQRDFRITIGLREGYQASGRIYDIEEAVRAAHAWMKRRAEAGQPFLSGMFTRGEVVYAWPGADGKAGSDRELVRFSQARPFRFIPAISTMPRSAPCSMSWRRKWPRHWGRNTYICHSGIRPGRCGGKNPRSDRKAKNFAFAEPAGVFILRRAEYRPAASRK
jgi:hypothetical protein